MRHKMFGRTEGTTAQPRSPLADDLNRAAEMLAVLRDLDRRRRIDVLAIVCKVVIGGHLPEPRKGTGR